MTPDQAIALYEEHIARIGGVPGRLPLVVYSSDEDLACPGDPSPAGALGAHLAAVAALTEHARTRGSVVIHVAFDADDYRRWLRHRPDSRALRSLWAAEKSREP